MKFSVIDAPKFCTQCGEPLVKGTTINGFDGQAGTAIVRMTLSCPVHLHPRRNLWGKPNFRDQLHDHWRQLESGGWR